MNKIKKEVRLLVLSIVLLVSLLSISYAEPADITSPQPEYVDSETSTTCEVQGLFGYSLPDEENLEKAEIILVLVDETGNQASQVVDVIDEFLTKLGNDDTIYVHTFASLEGSSWFNQRLTTVRADYIEQIIRGRPEFAKKNLKVSTSAHGETDEFWPLNDADQGLIDSYEPGSGQFTDTPALIANRRFILSREADLDFTNRRPYRFFDKGCPLDNIVPKIITADAGNMMVLIPGEPFELDIRVDDEDINSPGSTEQITFALSDAPDGMEIEKVTPTTAKITFSPSTEESSYSFTVSAIDKQGDKDAKIYQFAVVVPLTEKEERQQDMTSVEKVADEAKSLPTYAYFAPLLLLLIIPIAFKRKQIRKAPLKWHKAQAKDLTDIQKVLEFLRQAKKRSEGLKSQIATLNRKIDKMDTNLKTSIKEKIRDVAYLYDDKSNEFKTIDKDGQDVKELLLLYVELAHKVIELHSDELTIGHVLDKIEKGHINLSDASLYAQLKHLITQKQNLISQLKDETEKTFTVIEEEARQGGILLSGVVSLIGGNAKQWKEKGFRKWIKEYDDKWSHFHDESFLRQQKNETNVKTATESQYKDAITKKERRSWFANPSAIWPTKKNRYKSVMVFKHMGEQMADKIHAQEAIYRDIADKITGENAILDDIIAILKRSEEKLTVTFEQPVDNQIIDDKFVNEDIATVVEGGIPPFRANFIWGDVTREHMSLTNDFQDVPLNQREVQLPSRILRRFKDTIFYEKYRVNGKYPLTVQIIDNEDAHAEATIHLRSAEAKHPAENECFEARGQLTANIQTLYDANKFKGKEKYAASIKSLMKNVDGVEIALDKFNPGMKTIFSDGDPKKELTKIRKMYGSGKFEGELLSYIGRLLQVTEKMCEKKVVPIGRRPAVEETMQIETPVELVSGMRSLATDDSERTMKRIEYLKTVHTRPLAEAIKDLKREIVRGTNPLLGDKYRILVRTDFTGKIYRPQPFKVVVFGKKYLKDKKKYDMFGEMVRMGIGPEVFFRDIYSKLKYPEMASNINDQATAIGLTILGRIGAIGSDIKFLHEESKMHNDTDSVTIIDKMIAVLKDEQHKLEHTMTALEEIEKHALDMKNYTSNYIKAFVKSLSSVAKDGYDWGSGERGEDDKGAENFASTLSKFQDIKEFFQLLIDDTVDNANKALADVHQANIELDKINEDWKRHVKEVEKLSRVA